MIPVLNFNSRHIPLEVKQRIANLQQAIWKAEEIIKLTGAEEGTFIFIQASAIIEVLEQQIEAIWNGN